MKARLKKFISLLLGVIITISSGGVVVASHSCLKKPGTEVSLFQHKGCCSKGKKNCHSASSPGQAFTKKCCQLTVSFHKVDVSSLPVKKNFIHADVFIRNFAVQNTIALQNYSAKLFQNKAPPKLAGRTLLTSISIFQI